MKKFLKKYGFQTLLIIPMLLYTLSFTLIPIIQTIWLGLKDSNTGQLSFSTYAYLLARPDFIQSIINTIVVSVIGITFQLIIALIVAMILSKSFRGRGLVRAFVLMPMGIPTLVSGIVALYIFGTSGYLNEVLFRLGLITTPINWTDGSLRGLLVIVFADTWKVLPTQVLLLLAGIQSISEELYESGKMDGASKWQQFQCITLPLLKPTITMAVLFKAVNMFRIFELPQVLVGKSIPFIATFAYEEYSLGNVNASGAASTILLIMILIFASLYIKFIDRGEGFGNG